MSQQTEPGGGKPDESKSGGGKPLSDFARSFIYSASQEWIIGLSQVSDHLFKTQAAERLRFMNAPDSEHSNWYAQTFGSALGMLVPLPG